MLANLNTKELNIKFTSKKSKKIGFEYFKTLVTATIPDPDELDEDDNIFL